MYHIGGQCVIIFGFVAAAVIGGGTGITDGAIIVISTGIDVMLTIQQYGGATDLMLLGENDGGSLLLGTARVLFFGCGGLCCWHGRGGACSFSDGDVTAAEGG